MTDTPGRYLLAVAALAATLLLSTAERGIAAPACDATGADAAAIASARVAVEQACDCAGRGRPPHLAALCLEHAHGRGR